MRTRQRTLRGELRDILRRIADGCTEYEYGQPHYLNAELLRECRYKLQRLRDEGLLSPGNTHLAHFRALLHDLEGQWDVPTGLPPVPGDEREKLLEINHELMDRDVGRLHARARTYVAATTKMDNGSYLAYLRWRRLGLRKSQGA